MVHIDGHARADSTSGAEFEGMVYDTALRVMTGRVGPTMCEYLSQFPCSLAGICGVKRGDKAECVCVTTCELPIPGGVDHRYADASKRSLATSVGCVTSVCGGRVDGVNVGVPSCYSLFVCRAYVVCLLMHALVHCVCFRWIGSALNARAGDDGTCSSGSLRDSSVRHEFE